MVYDMVICVPLHGRHFDDVEGTQDFHGCDARSQRLTAVKEVMVMVMTG